MDVHLSQVSESSPLLSSENAREGHGVLSSGHSTVASSSNSISPTPTTPKTHNADPPIPLTQLTILCSLAAVNALTFEIIFPFVNQMILELRIVEDPEQVGYYSGLIESLFAIMGLLSTMPWTYVSDRWGRKPVLLIGVIGMGVFTSLFGLSRSYWYMFATRSVSGVFGGGFTTLRVMLAELSTKANLGHALAMLGIVYRTGQVIGQPLGGILSHPERHWEIFDLEFWRNYPFALPCIVAGICAIVGFILGCIIVEETLPSKRRKKLSRSRSTYDAMNSVTTEASSLGPIARSTTSPNSVGVKLRDVLNRKVIVMLLNNLAMVFLAEVVYAVYPLYGFTPVSSGGLGLTEAGIGTHLSLRALFAIITAFPYGFLQRRFGSTKIYQYAMPFWSLSILFLPLLNWLARLGWNDPEQKAKIVIFDLVLLLFFTVWSFAFFTWVASGAMIVDAAPSQEALATINGIYQLTVGIAQSFAPVAGTSLFAFSKGISFAGGNLIWIVLFVLSCITFVHSLVLEEAQHDWREQRDLDREEASEN